MDQDELLALVAGILERLEIPYLVTGSIATVLYGEPRFTNDLDVVVQLDRENALRLVAAFPEGEFYVSTESCLRALERGTQFNVIHPRSGLKVDFMVASMNAFDERRFERGRRIPTRPESSAVFASPEDVILMKLVYYRDGGSDKHLRDIAGVLRITSEVDRSYVAGWAERLGVSDVWGSLLRELGP